MPDTVTCTDCQIAYPEGLLAPYFEQGTYTPLCGICALERVNSKHGVWFKKFEGELAETKRQQAIAYREQLKAKP